MRRSTDPRAGARLPAIVTAAILAQAVTAPLHGAGRTSTDLEREQFLRRAKIERTEVVAVGVTSPLRATLSLDGLTHQAHIQRIDITLRHFRTATSIYAAFHDCYRYNIAAYRLDRQLGLGMVPVSVERHHRGKRAAFTWWIEDVLMSDADRYQQKIPPPDPAHWSDQRYQARIFNQLVYNEDPNLGNFVIDADWRLWLVDFTRAFRSHRRLQEPRRVQRVDRRLYEGLRALELAELKRETAPYLTRPEMRAVMARRDRILEILEARISKLGPAAVICDLPGH